MTGLIKFIRNHKLLGVLVMVVVVGLISGTIFTVSTLGSGNEDKTVKQQGWNFTAKLADGAIERAEVDSNFKSAADVETYAEAMRKENTELFKAGVSQVTGAPIVFKRALTWDEADAFVKKYQLLVSSYEYRLVSKTDPTDRYTWVTGIAMDGKNPAASSEQARKQLDGIMTNELQGKTLFKGIIGMNTTLDGGKYQQVSVDSDVYLVDMPHEIIKAKIDKDALVELKGVKKKNDFFIPKGSPQLYRRMEDFGLASK